MPLQHAAHRHRNGAGLLRDDGYHRVGMFAGADAGPVPHAQVPGEVHVSRQGEHAACAHNAPVADDDRTVMEGRLVPEQVFQQLAAHRAVQRGAGLDGIVEKVLPLKDHQRAGLALGQSGIGLHSLLDGVFDLIRCFRVGEHVAKAAAAHLLQKFANLRLEQDDKCQNTPFHHFPKEKIDGTQLQQR